MSTLVVLVICIGVVLAFVAIAWGSAQGDFTQHRKLMSYYGKDRHGNWK